MTTNPPHSFGPLRDRLENEFADMLAHDLRANGTDRVHIVLAAETDLMCSGEFSAVTAPRLHVWLKPFVRNWTGAAPAMLIDVWTIARDCPVGRLDLMTEMVTAIAVHELGHVCCVAGLFGRDDLPPDMTTVVRQVFLESLATKATFYSSSPRTGHGPEWLRACCHLVSRMQQRGWEVRLPMVVDNEFYQLSSTSKYSHALGDECERLADWPLTSIATIPPPRKFLDQWDADLAAWPDGEL